MVSFATLEGCSVGEVTEAFTAFCACLCVCGVSKSTFIDKRDLLNIRRPHCSYHP